MKIVINKCYGGFGLSDAAYLRLNELGVPIVKYKEEKRNDKTGLFEREPTNEGRVIFDRRLEPQTDLVSSMMRVDGTFWNVWFSMNRADELLVRVVEELGEKSSGKHAELKVVEIPEGVKYTIEEYDGIEHIAEEHRTWG